MKRFTRSEITTFLRAVDAHLSHGLDLVIIGGAAAALSFGSESGTLDIDLKAITPRSRKAASAVAGASSLDEACTAARKDTGMDIPMAHVGIWEAPGDFEGRFKRLRVRGLKKLGILVPEKHDWALMKIVRLYDKDIEDIKEVADNMGLDKALLLRRFLEGMTHIEPRRRLITHFVTMMEELYGKAEADGMEAEIRKRWKPA